MKGVLRFQNKYIHSLSGIILVQLTNTNNTYKHQQHIHHITNFLHYLEPSASLICIVVVGWESSTFNVDCPVCGELVEA